MRKILKKFILYTRPGGGWTIPVILISGTITRAILFILHIGNATSLLTKLNVLTPVLLPDVSTKEKAQQYIGLDLSKLREVKKVFLETVIQVWIKLQRRDMIIWLSLIRNTSKSLDIFYF